MTTYQERREIQEKIDRAAKRARSSMRSLGMWMPTVEKNADIVIWSSIWDAVGMAVETASYLIEYLPDRYFTSLDEDTYDLSDDLQEQVQELVDQLQARRKNGSRQARIAKLANTEGRTPEEAKLYLAKADELSARLKGGTK